MRDRSRKSNERRRSRRYVFDGDASGVGAAAARRAPGAGRAAAASEIGDLGKQRHVLQNCWKSVSTVDT